ncbi:MAG: glycosyltransferase family 4 protein [Lachnospiraceae bacterium]|nr:glycosyltransferase family 4 protein [Lachnospiraceae bacterium]
MKIAFVDLGRHFGGIEVYMLSLLAERKKQGKKDVILARKDSAFFQKLTEAGYGKETLAVGFDLGSIREARRRLKEEKVEMIHTNGINSGMFASLLGLKVKCVATVHGDAAFDRIEKNILIQRGFVWLENRLLKKCNQVIAVSEAIKEILIGRGIPSEKIKVIHNGIEKMDYTAAEGPDGQEKNLFRICFVGRLEKVKGCEYLIKALAELKDQAYLCDIYGEGSLKEELKLLCKEVGIEEKVVFKGFSGEIRKVLNLYDVLVQPSLFEAFPLTPLEAMNAGVLVIGSNVGGMKELIQDGETGLKFEAGQAHELAEKIRRVIENEAEAAAIKENAYRLFEEEYTKEIMCEKTFKLLESI